MLDEYPTPEEWDEYYDYIQRIEDRLGCEDEFPEGSPIGEDDQDD